MLGVQANGCIKESYRVSKIFPGIISPLIISQGRFSDVIDKVINETRTIGLVRFSAFYVLEVVRANLRVAYDVITPTDHAKPGIVAVPLDARSDVEVTLLANLITMTPGSLAVDVADDRSVIYVHAMYVDDPDELRRQIKDDLERRVLELLR